MKKPKKVLLLGAGHSHIQVLHRLSLADPGLAEVTLVSSPAKATYSGMLPGFMAGAYQIEELQFDLSKLSQKLGFQFVESKVAKISASENRVILENGSILSYDLASINIGIEPKKISQTENLNTLYVKPIANFIDQWESFCEGHSLVNIIGGGAAAFEIAVACRLRFPKSTVQLFPGTTGLLSSSSISARKKAFAIVAQNQILIATNSRVQAITHEKIQLQNGDSFASGFTIVAISAEAPKLFKESGLPTTEDGFVKIGPDLRVEGFSNLFASGDCAYFTSSPLEKAGVFAVRQGPVLSDNLIHGLTGTGSRSLYKPQNQFLMILMSGQKRALATYGKFSIEGPWAWRLKNFIDKRFMAKFA